MKQRAVGLIADYLSTRRVGRVVGLKRVGDDDYVLANRDVVLEMFRTCISCQADLVELAVELHLEAEME